MRVCSVFSGLVVAAALAIGAMGRGALAQGDPVAGPAVVRYAMVELGPTGAELIGVQITDDAIRNALNLIQARSKPDLVILHVRCTGGMLREVPQIVDLITGMQAQARVVAWVEDATSSAALVALGCPEIVMSTDGTIGAAVVYEMRDGKPVALGGEELERALSVGAEIARRTGRDPRLIRAMQTPTPLSYDLGPDGAVTLVEGTGGRVLLSSDGTILTLAAPRAQEIGLSLGTADTIEGVMALLGVRQAQNVGLVAGGALNHRMAKATEALDRMTAAERDLWDALDHAREADGERARSVELQLASESLAVLKKDVEEWPDVAAYLRLDESTLGAYGGEIKELGTPDADPE